jgi:hypothetical protein
LNFTTFLLRLIFTDRASFRRAVSKKSLISLICFGMMANPRLPHLVFHDNNNKGLQKLKPDDGYGAQQSPVLQMHTKRIRA